ncbi:MAG: ATP-binding protein [Mucinivorans sp.]
MIKNSINLDAVIKKENQVILDALKVGVIIYDREARQEYLNDFAYNLLAITDRDAHIARRINLFDDPVVNSEIINLIRRGEDVDVVVDYNMNTSTHHNYFNSTLEHVMFIDTKVRYVKNTDNSIEKYILIMEDVTEKRFEKMQRNSKILSISMNALNAFTWFFDSRDGMLRYGERFEMLGIDRSDVCTIASFASRIHPDQRNEFLSYFETLTKRDSGDFTVEYQIDFNNDGHYEWWESRGVIEMVEIGKYSYKYMYGMDINIDKRKQSELNLVKNRAELDALNKQNHIILNNTNSGLVYIDNDYVVQWDNLASFLPNHPLVKNYKRGYPCHKSVRGLDYPCPNCVVERSNKSKEIEVKEFEYEGLVAELTAIPIFNDLHERIGTVMKVLNITEKKRIQREIVAAKNRAVASEKLMLKIIDCMPCILFIKDVDNDFRHIVVNQQFCKVVGLEYDKVMGKTDYDIFYSKEEADRCHNDDLATIASGKVNMYEEETFFGGNRIVWQTTKVCMVDSDGRRLLIAISLDITSKQKMLNELQKAKEKAEELNRLKSAFLANMSHEIRTPLNAIIGFSGLVADSTCDEDKKEYLDIIDVNNDLLLRLIDDILDLSKIEAGMMQLRPTEFDVVSLFKDLETMFEMRIVTSKIEFLIESPYRSCIVNFDRDRLIQVITNFMTNAIKFTAKGEIVLGYDYRDGVLRVYVRDTGIGIAKDKLDRVFERFEKLDNFAQGTGLGMAICKAVAEICNGKIGVESTEGEGSTFWFSVPIKAEISV